MVLSLKKTKKVSNNVGNDIIIFFKPTCKYLYIKAVKFIQFDVNLPFGLN